MEQEEKTALRGILFRHLDGIAVGPTVSALYEGGISQYILKNHNFSFKELSSKFEINDGYMNVALRLLASQGWLCREILNEGKEIDFKLTEKGEVPQLQQGSGGAVLTGADKSYKNFCSSCHGQGGKGDTDAAKALNPRPRNFSDQSWQKKVDDDYIAKVIREGGAAVGKSASMAPWGAVLNDKQIKDLVKKIRDFAKLSE